MEKKIHANIPRVKPQRGGMCIEMLYPQEASPSGAKGGSCVRDILHIKNIFQIIGDLKTL